MSLLARIWIDHASRTCGNGVTRFRLLPSFPVHPFEGRLCELQAWKRSLCVLLSLVFFLPCNCRHRGSRGAHRKATSLNIAKLPCRSWIGLFRILARLFVVYTMDVLGVSLGLLVESTVRLAAVKPCTMMLLD